MEGLDGLLDRLGFYDLIGVLLPGMIATFFTIIADEIVLAWNISKFIQKDNAALFLCVSYFAGVVLQEAGSLIMKILLNMGGKKLICYAMKCNDKSRESITTYERNILDEEIKKAFPNKDNSVQLSLAYDYCKHMGGNSSAAEKDHSIAAMSRCMCVYFLALGVGLLIKGVKTHGKCVIFAALISFLLMIIMGYRSYRFYKIRYIRIFRKYYFEHHIKNNT